MNYKILYNNMEDKRKIDIIKHNKIQKEIIMQYNKEDNYQMEQLIKYLKENKYLYIHIDRSNKCIKFSRDKINKKSSIYLIKEVIPSQYFKDIDEINLYVTIIKSYKTSVLI